MVQILLSSFEQGRKTSNNVVCLLIPTQINPFDRTLVGWKNHSKAVKCQSEVWQCLTESTSVVVSWLLLRPTRLNPTSCWDTIMYVPWTPGPCLTPGLETSSTVLLPVIPLTPPRCLPLCPLFSSITRGCWPSVFIAHRSSSVPRVRAGAV